MKKSKAMLFIAPALFSYALAAQACTTLAIQDKQGDVFHGRTLEYMQDLPSWLTYYPAGTQFDKKTPDGSQGVSYQAKYPILAITSTITDGDSRDILEGMNSAGLSFSENMIMNAQLPPLPASEYKQAIPVTSLGEWALARFATVGEVKQAIKEGKFWSPELHRFGDLKSPFHYAFYDKKGGSIIGVNNHAVAFFNIVRHSGTFLKNNSGHFMPNNSWVSNKWVRSTKSPDIRSANACSINLN